MAPPRTPASAAPPWPPCTCRRHQSATASTSAVSSTSLMPPWNAAGTRVSSASRHRGRQRQRQMPGRAGDVARRIEPLVRPAAATAAPASPRQNDSSATTAGVLRLRRKPLRPARGTRSRARGSATACAAATPPATPPQGPAPGSATTPRRPHRWWIAAQPPGTLRARHQTTPPAPSPRPPDRADARPPAAAAAISRAPQRRPVVETAPHRPAAGSRRRHRAGRQHLKPPILVRRPASDARHASSRSRSAS